MAILFNRNIQNLFLLSGVIWACQTRPDFVSGTFGVTVFSGSQPSAATIASNWTNYNTTFLAHWQTVQIKHTNYNTTGSFLELYAPVGSSTAANSGTASWAIMWPNSTTQANVSSSTLPSNQFIVVPVSDTAGNGVIRFINNVLVSGSSYQINDVLITPGGGSA